MIKVIAILLAFFIYTILEMRSLINIAELHLPLLLEYVIRIHINDSLRYDKDNMRYEAIININYPLLKIDLMFTVRGSYFLKNFIYKYILDGILIYDNSGNINLTVKYSKEFLDRYPKARNINEGIPVMLSKNDYKSIPIEIIIQPAINRESCFLKLKAKHIPKGKIRGFLSWLMQALGLYRIRIEYVNSPIKLTFKTFK